MKNIVILLSLVLASFAFASNAEGGKYDAAVRALSKFFAYEAKEAKAAPRVVNAGSKALPKAVPNTVPTPPRAAHLVSKCLSEEKERKRRQLEDLKNNKPAMAKLGVTEEQINCYLSDDALLESLLKSK